MSTNGLERTAYLSGPMRGYPEFNFPAFEDACSVLRAHGWIIISPHEHDLELGINPTDPILPEWFDIHEVLKWDLQQVMEADAIIMLPGWQDSSGAQVELHVAEETGKTVYQLIEGRLFRNGKEVQMKTVLKDYSPDVVVTMSWTEADEVARFLSTVTAPNDSATHEILARKLYTQLRDATTERVGG